MNSKQPVYRMPQSIRYVSGAIFLTLAIYALLEAGLSSLPRWFLFIALVAISVCLVLKAAVELFTVLFAHFARFTGRLLGRCFAIARDESRD